MILGSPPLSQCLNCVGAVAYLRRLRGSEGLFGGPGLSQSRDEEWLTTLDRLCRRFAYKKRSIPRIAVLRYDLSNSLWLWFLCLVFRRVTKTHRARYCQGDRRINASLRRPPLPPGRLSRFARQLPPAVTRLGSQEESAAALVCKRRATLPRERFH